MAEWSRRIGSGGCEGLTTTPQGDCFLAVTIADRQVLLLAVGGHRREERAHPSTRKLPARRPRAITAHRLPTRHTRHRANPHPNRQQRL